MACDRFWSKVDVRGPDDCWPWIAGKDRDGYGRFREGRAHRVASAVALEFATGEVAAGRQALHACDNPPCCNPNHLRWGTHAENHAECDVKRRRRYGERNAASKLTAGQVREIRVRYASRSRTCGAPALAKTFGVSAPLIEKIVAGKIWVGV